MFFLPRQIDEFGHEHFIYRGKGALTGRRLLIVAPSRIGLSLRTTDGLDVAGGWRRALSVRL